MYDICCVISALILKTDGDEVGQRVQRCLVVRDNSSEKSILSKFLNGVSKQ